MVKIKFNKEESKHVFFTSDTHFYHRNIIRFCNRPFSSIEEMNEKLIENWNSVVGPDDYIFHLGDFSFAGSDKLKDLLSKLNGHIYLIKGNHDRMSKGMESLFYYTSYEMFIEVDKVKIYLNHYPFLTYTGAYKKNVIQLFGHIHNNKGDRYKLLLPTQYNVGVDVNNFTPVSWSQLKDIIDKQNNKINKFKRWIIRIMLKLL